MYRIFKSELYKISTPLKIISMIVGTIVLVSLISVLEYYAVFRSTQDSSIEMFMTMNLNFIIMNFILPIIMIVLTSSSFAEEYDFGMIQSYLLCGVDKKDVYFGKLLYLNAFLIVIVIMLYLELYLAGCIIVNDASISINIFGYLPKYIYAGIAIELIILVTILFSLILENNNKTILASIGLMFFSMIMDSVFAGKFYSITSFISNINLFYQDNIGEYINLLVLFLVYVVVLNIINLVFFKNKDIWR